MKERTVNASKNVLAGFAYRFSIMFLTFTGRSVFIQHIGIDYLGINSLFSEILSLLSLADLGIATAMSYSLYKPLADNDEIKITALINFFRKIYNLIALSIAIIGIALIPFLKYIIHSDLPMSSLYSFYIISLLQTVISYLFIYKSTLISASQRNYIVYALSIIINAIKVIAQIVVCIVLENYIAYLLIGILTVLVNNIILSTLAGKYYPYIKRIDLQLADEDKRRITNNIKSVFIYKVASTLLNATDNTIISITVSTIAVGLYANYYSIYNNLTPLVAIIFSSLSANVGNLVATEKEDKRYEVFCVMQTISFWLSGFCTVCFYVLVQDFIVLWIGEQYLFNTFTVIAITLNLYFTICMQPIWSFREATGIYQQTKYIMCITAALNLALSFILGYRFGVGGVILASVISRVSTYIWYEPVLLFNRFFGKSSKVFFVKHMFNIMVIVFCIALNSILLQFMPTGTWKIWIYKGVICTIVVNAIYFILYFKTQEFQIIKSKVCFLLSPIFQRLIHKNIKEKSNGF